MTLPMPTPEYVSLLELQTWLETVRQAAVERGHPKAFVILFASGDLWVAQVRLGHDEPVIGANSADNPILALQLLWGCLDPSAWFKWSMEHRPSEELV